MHRLLSSLISGAFVLYAIYLDWKVAFIALFAGVVLSGTLDGAIRDGLASLEPATRAQRRIANASARAVEQRMQSLNRDTGEHGAQKVA